MKLRLELGFPVIRKFQIAYYGGELKDFHKIVKCDGEYWIQVAYQKDKTGTADYMFIFDKYSNEPPDEIVIDLEERYGISAFVTKCECGSIYERGFENVHSPWCPKWENV